MDTAHRKIELQAPGDLAFLEQNARKAARERIDLHLPPSAAPVGGEDKLRGRVEELVEEFLTHTFAAAKQNICVNGMDLEENGTRNVGEDFEPLDTRLADRLRALEQAKESLITKVADLRRTAPALAARQFQSAYGAYDAGLQQRRQEEEDGAVREAQGERLEVERVERWDEVEGSWERATEGLVGLRGVTETVARLVRAGEVVGYLEGK
ncbi:hypothetical protein M501DRAFT_324567 [Patellaria atrata CBS 101060]|uniref:Kinetochore protein mis14 n=1 Tax=Patellaria atrata CBS 101060 TaxID=1346257 RepID=A0A9P4VLK6_9PEZI|nr:hypothetical protein M501DRAFT_324567 [Patellaria atrata CBS 101060]